MTTRILTIFILCFCLNKTTTSQPEFNTVLMNSTYKIYGIDKSSENKYTIGTCFIIGRPVANDSILSSYVLVTAKHVLEDINNDFASIELRIRNPDDTYYRISFKIQIRDNGIPNWSQSTDRNVDIAAMYLGLPDIFRLQFRDYFIPMNFLSDDSTFAEMQIHPGDVLFSLGYPEGISSNDFGFPVLRNGLIASYPIFPSSLVQSFLLDTEVYSGNSGGPVYFYQEARALRGNFNVNTFATIVGIMTDQILYQDERKINDSLSVTENKPLKLAKVIPSHFIREVINSLPVILTKGK